ncbi:hypothetical protein D3C81_193250 [compost metagenome]|jgi:hypothetical protein
MAFVILFIVYFNLYLVWKCHKNFIETGEENVWSKIALWGVRNFSPVGMGVILVIFVVLKVWLMVLVVGSVWIVYRMILNNIAAASAKEKG